MRLVPAIALLTCLAVPSSAHAATMRYVTPTELTLLSDAVVLAHVVEVQSEREADGRIVTRTRLQVAETWSGTAPAELWVRQWGGRVDDEVQRVAGDAVLADRVAMVVFLRRSGAADAPVWTLTALSQSVFVFDVVPPDMSLASITLGEPLEAVGARIASAGWARSLEGVLDAESGQHHEIWRYADLRRAVATAASGLPIGEPDPSAVVPGPSTGASHE